jgi:hypothetical protein
VQGYYLTDRGRKLALRLKALDDEHTEQFESVSVDDEAEVEQTEIIADAGTLDEPTVEATVPGRHRLVRKSRLSWVRERLTIARVAVLSASAGVLLGVGFMWLVTR